LTVAATSIPPELPVLLEPLVRLGSPDKLGKLVDMASPYRCAPREKLPAKEKARWMRPHR
jgi:hypothetical protein